MERTLYDMDKLAEKNILDTTVSTWFFYNLDDYFTKLTEYAENYQHFLHNYNPTVVVVSDDERKVFIKDCASIRAVLTQLGMTLALNELNNLENAVLDSEIKELADGLTKFHANLEIYAKLLRDSKVEKVQVKPTVIVIVDSQKALAGMSPLLEDRYTVISYKSSVEALSAIEHREEAPSLFMITLEMPDICGYALAFCIREHARFKNTPIAFLTSGNKHDPLRDALPQSEERYIHLPVTDKTALFNVLDKSGGFR